MTDDSPPDRSMPDAAETLDATDDDANVTDDDANTADDDPNETAGASSRSTAAATTDTDTAASPLPEAVVDETERLTRLARQTGAGPEAATYRDARAETLAEHGYTARVRDEDDTLVLYPTAWLDGDTVQPARIDDTDRAVEVPLSATTGDGQWAEIEAYNATLVERVAEEYGQPHTANARAFADFMGNHYLMRIDAATAAHCEEFVTNYYPRNTWASTAQRDAVDTSLEYVFAVADTDNPLA